MTLISHTPINHTIPTRQQRRINCNKGANSQQTWTRNPATKPLMEQHHWWGIRAKKWVPWMFLEIGDLDPNCTISIHFDLNLFDNVWYTGWWYSGGHLSDAWRTCIYIYIYIYQLAMKFKEKRYNNTLLLQSSNFECLKFHQISSSNVPKEKLYPCCLWVGRWWSCSWFQLWKSPAWDGQQPYASLLGGAYPSNIRKKKKAPAQEKYGTIITCHVKYAINACETECYNVTIEV